jgi:hypothetical protein
MKVEIIRILYLSVHEVLEYDELKLFTELGYECFSHGRYSRPHIGSTLRPPIPEMKFDPHFADMVDRYTLDDLHPEMIEDKDIIIIMHSPTVIINNWEKFKNKRVIWRTIGQSNLLVENLLAPYREQGLEIIRYSPRERMIPGYIGEDEVIRFYKDPNEYNDWIGNKLNVMAINQAMLQRGIDSNYPLFHNVCKGIPTKLFGPHNEGLPESAGLLTYEQMKNELRENRAYFYTGTRIPSYTLGFIEAFMTGIPIVSVSELFGNHPSLNQRTFEIHEIIKNGKDGFISDNPVELKQYLQELLNNHDLAKRISANARKKAIQLFGKENIKNRWQEFLMKKREEK